MTRKLFNTRQLCACISLAIASSSFSSYAAENAVAVGDQEPVQANTLKSVTVTAEKRSEDIQKVPIAISVLDAEKLQAYGASGDTLVQLAAKTPSLQVESSYGRTFPRFYIRGLGNSDYDANASQPVSLVYDDIVQESPLLKGFPMFDLEQVEVLRGPQGTMFGRNSPAGVVKFDSVKPSEETGGYAKVSYGTYGTANLEGALGGKLGAEGWSGRVSFLYQHRDDWIDNAYTGKKDALGGYNDRAIRLQAMYRNDDFSALINVHARDFDGNAAVWHPNSIKYGSASLISGLDLDQVAQDGRNEENVTSWGTNLHLNWNLGDLTFTSITGLERLKAYSLGDVDGGYLSSGTPAWSSATDTNNIVPYSSESADQVPKHRQISQEFRLANDQNEKLKWQTGAYYFDEDIDINNLVYDNMGTTISTWVKQAQRTKAWALFGSADYRFNDSFDLRAGVRYSHDQRDYSVVRLFGYTGALAPQTAHPSDSRWSGDVTGTWAIDDSTNVYLRVANGFRAPSVQGRLTFANSISVAKAETITSYELGLKSLGWDGRLRFNADIYSFVMHDQQLTASNAVSASTILLNVDKTVGNGAEFDLEVQPNQNFRATLSGSYNYTKIKDDDLTVSVCSNCTVLDPLDSSGRAILDGNSLPMTPKYIGSFTARYGIPYGDDGEFFAYTDWNYRSRYRYTLYDSVEYASKAAVVGGLRLGYNWDLGRNEVALYARNLTDRRTIISTTSFVTRAALVSDPRIIGIEFSTRF